jgi:hypothetical protein
MTMWIKNPKHCGEKLYMSCSLVLSWVRIFQIVKTTLFKYEIHGYAS